jgi:hypothetical protein
MWHAWRAPGGSAATCPSQSPSRSWRQRAPWDMPPPWVKVSGSQPDLPTPGTTGGPRSFLEGIMPVLLGGKGTSHVGWDTGDLPSQGKKLRVSNPTRPRFLPHGSACGASVPPVAAGHSCWSSLQMSDAGASRGPTGTAEFDSAVVLCRGREHPLPQGALKVVSGGDA